MKSIITAMGNPTLNQELKRYAEFDVVGDDLFYQEAVIDLLQSTQVDVVTLSSILQGQWELFEFIDRIQKMNAMVRLIIIMDELDSDVKCGLLERGIQDIFLDDKVEIKDIIEAIEREEPLMRRLDKSKITVRENSEDVYDAQVLPQTPSKMVQKQEIIAIFGTNGSGKTTMTYQLSKTLASKTDSKILVIDFDTLQGNLEELFGVSKVPENIELQIDLDKRCGINYAADLIRKNRFDTNVFDEIVVHTDSVDLLTGNTSLYFCQEVLNETIYEQILTSAKEKYDFIFFDMSSNIFLDSTKWCLEKATKVFFVLENDYLNVQKANHLLDVIVKLWGVWKEKISLVMNQERSDLLDSDVIQKIFEEYPLIGKVKQNGERDETAYEKILETIHFVPKKKWTEKIHAIKASFGLVFDSKINQTISSKKELTPNAN